MRKLGKLGLAFALSACATAPDPETLPQVRAWLASGGPPPPPAAQCPYVSDVDLAAIEVERIRRDQESSAPQSEAYYRRLFNSVAVTGEGRSPSPGASVILTGVGPPGGLHSNTLWSVVWKEPDGRWWFWSQNRTNEPPPPPPYRPPPGAPEAEQAAYRAAMEDYPPADHVRWPPVHGLLSEGQAAAIERSLADPCRAWEPDRWPWDPPLRRARAQPGPPPPQDWTPFYVWIQERGRPARLISAPNERESHARVIQGVTAYPRP